LSVIINIGLAIYGWKHRHFPGAKAFSLALLLFMVWPLAQVIDLTTTDLTTKVILMKCRIDAPIFGGVAWLVMIAQLTNQMDLLKRRRLVIICSVPVLTMILNLSSYSFLFRHSYYLDYGGPFPILRWMNGVWFWVWFSWSYVIFILSVVFLGRSYRNQSHLSTQQGLTVLSAIALPLIVNLFFQIGITPVLGLNPASATFSISGILIILAVYRYNPVDVIPIARDLLIENMSDGVMVLDTQNRIVDVNPAMQQILGLTAGAMLGKNAESFLTSLPDMTTSFIEVQNTQAEVLIDTHYFDVHVSSLHNQFKRPVGRLIVVKDVISDKHTEQALKISEKNLSHVLESAPDAMLIVDNTGKITFANKQCETMFGYAKAELIGQRIELLLPKDISNVHETHRDSYFTEPKTRPMGSGLDLVGRCKDGTEFPVEIALSSLETEEGVLATAAIRDITKRKEAEHKYRTLVEQMPAVVYIDSVDETDTYAYVSPQIKDLLGYPLDVWEQDPFFWKKCVHPEDYERAVAVTPNSLIKERIIEEYRMIAQDGTVVWVRDHSTLVRDTNGEPQFVQGFWLDITENKRAEIRSRILYETLRAVGKHLDLTTIAQSAVDVISRLSNWTNISISIPVEAEHGWRAIAGAGRTIGIFGQVHSIDRGVTGRVYRIGKTQYVPDTSRDPDYFQGKGTNTQSELAVPILHQDNILGVLNIESDNLDDFSKQDLSLAESLADVISLAMANAYQYAETQAELNERRLTEKALIHAEEELKLALKNTEILFDIAKVGISAVTLPSLLQEMVERVARNMPANRVTLIIFDLPSKKIRDFVRGGPGADQVDLSVAFEELMDGLSGWAIRTGRSVLSPKGEPDPRESEAIQKRRKETNCGSIIVTSLQYQESVLGTLTLINLPDEPDFTSMDVELIEAVAGQISSSIVKVTLEDNLRKQNDWLATLHQVTFDLLTKHDIDELLQSIVEQAARFLDAHYSEIMLLENEELVVKAVTKNHHQLLGDHAGRAEAALIWQAFDTQLPVMVEDYSLLPERRGIYDGMDIGAVVVLPILIGHESLGLLGISRPKTREPFGTNEIQAASLFSRLAALALENAQLHEMLREESIRDPLTGLFNRRFMMETLANELSRAERNATPLSVVIFDLDGLKEINDQYGHNLGDEALCSVSHLLKAKTRISDTACRYGGDEFILILSNTTLASARQRMRELREETKQKAIEHEGNVIKLTLSIGIAEYPTHGSTGQELIKAADIALYRAKQAGRDQVMVA